MRRTADASRSVTFVMKIRLVVLSPNVNSLEPVRHGRPG